MARYSIRNDGEAVVRVRCLRFLGKMLRGVSFTHIVGNNCTVGLDIDLDDLTTNALERIALDAVDRFWRERRQFARYRRAA